MNRSLCNALSICFFLLNIYFRVEIHSGEVTINNPKCSVSICMYGYISLYLFKLNYLVISAIVSAIAYFALVCRSSIKTNILEEESIYFESYIIYTYYVYCKTKRGTLCSNGTVVSVIYEIDSVK